MPEQRKIKSVTELANHRVGDVMWWVILRPTQIVPELNDDDRWMENHHPKVIYEWGPGKVIWGKALLPKMQHIDFGAIVSLLTNKLLVEQFTICDIIRSKNSGEFFYSNDSDEWMPESMLLDNKKSADREKSRILKMMKKWISNNS